MPPDLQGFLRALQRRVLQAAFLQECARWLLPSLFVVGALILGLRWWFDFSRAESSWVLLALLAVPFAAAWRARWLALSPLGAATWLDRETGGSGRVLFEIEVGDERWRAAPLELPTLPRLRPGRFFAPSLVPLAFLGGALWFEKPPPLASPPVQLTTQMLEVVEEKLAALDEELTLDEETVRELEERLERLREGLDESPLESTLEALDRLAQSVAREAEEARAAAERAEQGLEVLGEGASAEARQAALETALSELREHGLGGALPPELASAALEGMTADEFAKLAGELGSNLDAKLSQLAAKGLLKPGSLRKPGQFGTLDEFSDHVCDEHCKRGGT